MVRAILDGRKTQTRRIVKMPAHKTTEGREWIWWPERAYADHGFPTDEQGDVLPIEQWQTAPADCFRNWYLHVPNAHPDDFDRRGDEGIVDRVYSPWVAGDRLWVRERVALNMPVDQFPRGVADWATDAAKCSPSIKWRPSIHMPRWASRITLELTSVRVERVQDISEDDARAEGCTETWTETWWQGYRELEGELHHQQAIGDEPPAWMVEPKRMNTDHLRQSCRDNFSALWTGINGMKSWSRNDWVWALTFRRIVTERREDERGVL
jgi:hypothetical protein